jgi:WW domain-containing oxidoreductase
MSHDRNSTAEEVTAGLDLSGQTWLITGVNSGLGYESARVLAMRGARIVGLARTEAKAADALAALGIAGDAVACELSEAASVRAAIEAVRGLGELNGILANAGIMALPEQHVHHGLELQFLTNHVGHHLLVTGLVDQLAPGARVVVLSSGAHFLAKRGLELDNLDGGREYEAWRMYGRSKLANILFARGLAKRLAARGDGTTANAVHPGVIQTNLARHVPDKEALYARMANRAKTVEQGAATQCYVAVNPEVAGISGEYFVDCAVSGTRDEVRDDALVEELWQVTEAWLTEH